MDTIDKNYLDSMNSRLHNVEKNIIRILGILETDDRIKEAGLVEKVSKIDRTLTELLTREKIYKAKATTWGIIGGAVGTSLLWLIKTGISKFLMI